MTIIWWTFYILGALTLFSLWVQVMAFLGTYLRARLDRMSNTYSGMSHKEVAAHSAKLEISHAAYPGLHKEVLNIKTKEDK